MEGFVIIEANRNHVRQIVKVHLSAFPGFFLSELGPFFLKVYYRSITRSKDGIALVLLDSSENVIGFCIGSEQSRGFHTRLIKRNLLEYFIAGLVVILINPGGFIRLIRNLEKKSSSADNGGYSEVLSIAINPDYKAKGLGYYLLTTFERAAMSKGGRQISLTTDYYGNDSVIEFYKKCGYKVMDTFYSYPNRRMYRMIKELY